MEKFKQLILLKCEDCGETFFGLVGKYCPKCRRKRRQKKDMAVKVCRVCGVEKHMFADQVICTDCMHAKARETSEEPRGLAIVEQRRKARQNGGKLTKIEVCPNFKGSDMNCVTCEPGSWKFKDCGRRK